MRGEGRVRVGGGGARWGGALALGGGATLAMAEAAVALNAPVRLAGAAGALGETGGKPVMWARKTGVTSLCVASGRRRHRRIREKVIGHGWRARAPQIGVVQRFRAFDGTIALLHEPARKHSRGIFLEPLIQQRAHLLAKIRGVGQPCEFVALQRVFGRGEQELPGRLGRVARQGGPPCRNWSAYNNRRVIRVKVYDRVLSCGKVWKSGGSRGAHGPWLRRPASSSMRAGL